jgi:hypothetical protein
MFTWTSCKAEAHSCKAFGLEQCSFPVGTQAGGFQIFELVATGTGLTEESALANGIESVTALVSSHVKHGLIPSFKPLRVKVIFDKFNRRLVGGK